jgi:hypothetical protein
MTDEELRPERKPDFVETAPHVVFAYQDHLGLGVSVEGNVLFDVGEYVAKIWLLDSGPS